MKRALTKIAIGLAAVGAIVGIAGKSQAADTIYDGTNCVEENTTSSAVKYSYLGAFNTSSSAKYWDCGLIRTNGSVNQAVTGWDVTINRRASNLAWDIQVQSMDSTGNNGWGSTITVPSSDGYQTLSGSSVDAQFTNGKLHIITLVPPAAQIARIHIAQQ